MESSGITSNRIESYHATLKAIRVKWVLLIEDDKDEDDDEDVDEDDDVFFCEGKRRIRAAPTYARHLKAAPQQRMKPHNNG